MRHWRKSRRSAEPLVADPAVGEAAANADPPLSRYCVNMCGSACVVSRATASRRSVSFSRAVGSVSWRALRGA